ncbi:MAG: hypothetical protein KAR40_13965 [Candidatus Sabulitectum sp.]|nr:hypothetical protein [Candidatus Sabulitectum sp.]
MKLELLRYAGGTDSTGGLLKVDGEFFCYTCEDEKREVKVAGETRVPEGYYRVVLRDAGGMTKRYAAKYPFHRGMLHILDVPGFEWIYIHVGNTDDHTEGCILVGYGANHRGGENTVARSVDAYTALYMAILGAIDRGEDITISIKEI